jgi:hypothetical protein
MEEFKNIHGYEDIYQVSSMGNVKSLGNDKTRKEKILKPSNNGGGYYQVVLFKDGKPKTMRVHILVAQAFLGHIPDGTHKIEVDHINNNQWDNRVENLQLLSCAEHRIKTSKNRNTSSKYIGVHWHKLSNKWQAKICIDGKYKHLGLFTDEYEAHLAYQNALNNLNNI